MLLLRISSYNVACSRGGGVEDDDIGVNSCSNLGVDKSVYVMVKFHVNNSLDTNVVDESSIS